MFQLILIECKLLFVLKTFEQFITCTENLSQTESEWIRISSELPDMILGNLVTCHNLSSKLKQIRGQTFYLFGRTHRLISELKFQQRQVDLNEPSYISASLALSKWSPIIIEMIKAQQMLGNNSDAFLKRCLSYKCLFNRGCRAKQIKGE